MLLDFLGWHPESAALKAAVKAALLDNVTTPDLHGSHTTAQVSDFLLAHIAKHS